MFKGTPDIWYNPKRKKCEFLSVIRRTHQKCVFFDEKASIYGMFTHTHEILASYSCTPNERSYKADILYLRRSAFRGRQYICRGCAAIHSKRHVKICSMCGFYIETKHINTASYFRNVTKYIQNIV